ncbi:DASS family sodium-coupled anion symporter [Campylobacter sp. RM12651]|uniref:DASS family sodium-coupled anion symporter n=1 Tax=Campylobacter sp. RM12651 TaxID=1660079 RepID=UPI001EFB985D|nr:DASS family sodium-coupled anion symporter [Campylobacter sp. RM12651]ULO02651.1 sodium:sulfate symporter family protein [Campylobacter sp. RM12651]
MKRAISIIILIAIPFLFATILPVPSGLSEAAWVMFGIYLSAVLGLVFKPIPNSMVLITAVAGTALFMGPYLGGAKEATKQALSGYASSTTWIIVSAFALSIAFTKTGLGKRWAYFLIGKFGKTTLRLSYVTAFLDLVVSPATPSNTARAGGIVFPIVNSIAQSLSKDKVETENRVGAFLACNSYMSTKMTSFIFATAMAGNMLVIGYANDILGTHLNWGNWAVAMIIPGIVCLCIIPLVVYIFVRPDIKKIDNVVISKQGLEELGEMKRSEKMLVLIFVLALLGWSVPSLASSLFGLKIDIDATAVAVGAMSLSVLLGVLKFEDIAGSKECIGTLFWFGGIMSLSGMMNKLGFFKWLGTFIQGNMNLDLDPLIVLIIIGFISIIVRYLYASATVFITTLLPVLFLIGKSAGVDPYLLAFLLITTNSYGGALTHFGGPAASVIFGAGYNTVKEWWITGFVVAMVSFILCLAIGLPYWEMLGMN